MGRGLVWIQSEAWAAFLLPRVLALSLDFGDCFA